MSSNIKGALAVVLPLGLCALVTVARADGVESKRPLETITVIGTQSSIESAAAEVALTPGGVDLIDMDAYRERNVSSLADVLKFSPGIWAASDSGTDGIFFSSRGSNLDATDYDMNGIKLLQDGLPVTGADGNNHNRVIDPLSARHATVARGANALKYGASTLGGAIDFVSVTARDSADVDLSMSGGSFGQRRARFVAARVFDEQFDGLLTVEGKQWDGFREHNKQDRLGVYANGGWQVSKQVATRLYATWLENDQELAGSLTRAEMDADPNQANPSAVSGNFQLNVDTLRLASKTSWQMDASRQLEFGLSYEEQSLFHPIVDRVMVDFDGPGPALPVEVFSLLIQTEQKNIGASLRYRQLVGRHELLAGANYGTTTGKGGNYRNLGGVPNGLTTSIDNDASSLELFVMDRWLLSDNTILVAALQGSSASREIRNYDIGSAALSNPASDYTRFNPRLGLIYSVRDSAELYANISRLYEPPTNFQLQDNVLGGDATLDAMHGSVLEAGTRGSMELGADSRWGWDVSVYYAAIDDEILSVEDPFAPGTSLATNIDQTVHAGVEALFNASISIGQSGRHHLVPVVNLTLNDFKFDSDTNYGDKRLPAAPLYALRGEVVYHHDNGFYLGPTFDVIGKRYADFSNTYRIDEYMLFGLRSGWSNDRWSVFADLVNLADKNYVANNSVRDIAEADAAILNPGTPRSVFVGVRRQFR